MASENIYSTTHSLLLEHLVKFPGRHWFPIVAWGWAGSAGLFLRGFASDSLGSLSRSPGVLRFTAWASRLVLFFLMHLGRRNDNATTSARRRDDHIFL
jgi:hypothetical protein